MDNARTFASYRVATLNPGEGNRRASRNGRVSSSATPKAFMFYDGRSCQSAAHAGGCCHHMPLVGTTQAAEMPPSRSPTPVNSRERAGAGHARSVGGLHRLVVPPGLHGPLVERGGVDRGLRTAAAAPPLQRRRPQRSRGRPPLLARAHGCGPAAHSAAAHPCAQPQCVVRCERGGGGALGRPSARRCVLPGLRLAPPTAHSVRERQCESRRTVCLRSSVRR
jgi:hypothetical protein